MTDEQKAAWIMSQSVCALADIMGMHAENMARDARDEMMAYEDEAFFEVPKKYGIHHQQVIDFITSG